MKTKFCLCIFTHNNKKHHIMKKLFYIIPIIVIILFSVSIYAYNYLTFQTEMNKVIENDSRNKGIDVSVHYKNYLPTTNVLIFDLKEVSGSNSKTDVFRVLLQFAEKVQNKKLDEVILSYKGKDRFKLKGNYFGKLGREYNIENPLYTMRTFPENVLTMNGLDAFPVWTGGLLGISNEQIQDFNKFFDEWMTK